MDPQLARDMDQIINNILEEDLDNEDNFDQLFWFVLTRVRLENVIVAAKLDD